MNNDQNNLDNHDYKDDIGAEKLQNITRAGLNMATHGAWNKVRNAPIVGDAAKRSEQKLANNLGNRFGNKEHQRPNLGVQPNKNDINDKKAVSESNNNQKESSNYSKKTDIASQNLKKSVANRARNIWQARRKNKLKNQSDGESSDNSNNSENSDEEKSENTFEDNLKARIKRKILIKVAMFGLVFFAIYVMVFILVVVVTGGGVFKSAPMIASKSYGTDSFESLTNKDSKYYNDEIAYYKKIKEASSKTDDLMVIDYTSAILLQLYYEDDYEYEDESLKETAGINYAKMTEKFDSFANVINSSNSSDYSINGPIYNAIKNSDVFKEYYKNILKKHSADDVVKRIFELAAEISSINDTDDTVITKETEVSVKDQNKSGTKTIKINDYIADSIYANTNSLQNSEVVKAYTIAYSTNLASQNKKLTVDSNSAYASNITCSVKEGCSYDKNGNLVSGPGSQNSKNIIYYKGGYYYKKPLTEEEIKTLNNNINSVFGNVLVNSDGTYPELDIDKINGLGDSYQNILNNSYGKLEIKNIGEDSYILDGSYGTKKVKTEVIFYDQGDYSSYNFCGKKKETIKTSGCGITSMAIIVSTYEKNSKYDPVAMMNAARQTGYCGGGIVGTSPGFFKKEANTMKYKYSYASKHNKKDLNNVLKHLSQNHLVIAHMSPGHFTSGGHYIVLGGVDPETKKVYVYDPNNKSNSSWRKTGNGWYSFNDIIVKESWGFYIVWKG